MEDLGRKSRIRNTLIADLLLRTPYIEKLGTGFIRMNKVMDELNLNPVTVSTDEYSFAIELSSQKTTQKTTVPKRTREKIIFLLQENPYITRREIMKELGKADATIKEHLSKLKRDGIIIRVGSDRSGYWEVV